MAMIPGFKHDIFISYAHIDNISLNEAQKGWVEIFQQTLSLKLIRHFGDKNSLNIWFDHQKIDGSTIFDDSIALGVRESAILLCIHSPAYQKSAYCQHELRTFYEKAIVEPMGLSVGKRSRLFNVLINNIPHKKWPQQLAGTTGFQFFTSSTDDHLGDTLDPASPQFETALNKLRDAIYHLISDMLEQPEDSAIAVPVHMAPSARMAPAEAIPHEAPRKKTKYAIWVLPGLAVMVLLGWLLLRSFAPPVPDRSTPKKQTTAAAPVDNKKAIARQLLKISKMNSADSDYQTQIDDQAAVYFSGNFSVSVSYGSDNTSAAKQLGDGKKFLYTLPFEKPENITVTGYQTDPAGKISHLDVVVQQQKDIDIAVK